MLKTLQTSLFISTSLLLSACGSGGGGGSRSNVSLQGEDRNGNPILIEEDVSQLRIRTWQDEFGKHQALAGQLPAKGDGYVITDENEMLLYRFAGIAINRTGTFSASNAYLNGVIYPKSFVAIGGKVFMMAKEFMTFRFFVS